MEIKIISFLLFFVFTNPNPEKRKQVPEKYRRRLFILQFFLFWSNWFSICKFPFIMSFEMKVRTWNEIHLILSGTGRERVRSGSFFMHNLGFHFSNLYFCWFKNFSHAESLFYPVLITFHQSIWINHGWMSSYVIIFPPQLGPST